MSHIDELPGSCRKILEGFAEAAKECFGSGLTGVYLHGSAVMGCFNPEKSDLDLLVVTETAPPDGEKRRFMEKVVSLNGKAPAQGSSSIPRPSNCTFPPCTWSAGKGTQKDTSRT